MPRTSKIYETRKMMGDEYITRQDNVYVAQVKPLAKEIQRIFEKFNIINYNEPPSKMKTDKPLLVSDFGRNTELDLFELKILEELLNSDLTKQAVRMRINTNLIKQSGGNFLLVLLRTLIEKSEMFEEQFDLERSYPPQYFYEEVMSKATLNTGFKYKTGLDPFKYFVKWKERIEKLKINPEVNLDTGFPHMDLLWSAIQERYRYNRQVLKDNDGWIDGYVDDAHFTLLMWLVPTLLINKFRRLKWEISEPNWAYLLLDNPYDKRTTGRGFYLK